MLSRLQPFDGSAHDPWPRVAAALRGRTFLHSEGMGADLAAPRRATPELVAQARELVARFDGYYNAIVDADSTDPARRIGEPYERVAELEGERPAIPLGRFDCVLGRDGRLRVIELNPIGVCTLHLRAVSYLRHRLLRDGDASLRAAIDALDEYRSLKLASMRSYVHATLAKPPARPVLGLAYDPNGDRGSAVFWKEELSAADSGFDLVVGRPEEIRVEHGRAWLGDRAIDALWADWFFYLGYQGHRYQQTRFASRLADFSGHASTTDRMLALPGFGSLIADRALTLISPVRAYRALSKALLAWVDRDELPVEDRAWLRDHVAKTWDHRARGALSIDEARRRRSELVWKPCRFGGSHGVLIGRDVDDEAWSRALEQAWTDPEWVLQEFSEPVVDEHGAALSFGLYDYAGTLGGILVRSAPHAIVSARTADIVAAVIGA